MRNDLMLHAGGHIATFQDLIEIQIPKETDTYKPLPYRDLIEMTREIAVQRLPSFLPSTEQFGLNRSGQQMFGILRYSNPDDPGLQLAIAMRTSYDKTMTTGLAAGGSVFVCDNLAFSGKVTYLRKHTGESMLQDLEEGIIRAVYAASSDYHQVQFDRDRLMQVPVDDRDAHNLLMILMFKEDVIEASRLHRTYDNWVQPPHEEFAPRNLWSLYNAVNEPLKGAKAGQMFEKHIKLHKTLTAYGKSVMGNQWGWGEEEEVDTFEFLAERVPV